MQALEKLKKMKAYEENVGRRKMLQKLKEVMESPRPFKPSEAEKQFDPPKSKFFHGKEVQRLKLNVELFSNALASLIMVQPPSSKWIIESLDKFTNKPQSISSPVVSAQFKFDPFLLTTVHDAETPKTWFHKLEIDELLKLLFLYAEWLATRPAEEQKKDLAREMIEDLSRCSEKGQVEGGRRISKRIFSEAAKYLRQKFLGSE